MAPERLPDCRGGDLELRGSRCQCIPCETDCGIVGVQITDEVSGVRLINIPTGDVCLRQRTCVAVGGNRT
jgi:hypothetical protein